MVAEALASVGARGREEEQQKWQQREVAEALCCERRWRALGRRQLQGWARRRFCFRSRLRAMRAKHLRRRALAAWSFEAAVAGRARAVAQRSARSAQKRGAALFLVALRWRCTCRLLNAHKIALARHRGWQRRQVPAGCAAVCDATRDGMVAGRERRLRRCGGGGICGGAGCARSCSASGSCCDGGCRAGDGGRQVCSAGFVCGSGGRRAGSAQCSMCGPAWRRGAGGRSRGRWGRGEGGRRG